MRDELTGRVENARINIIANRPINSEIRARSRDRFPRRQSLDSRIDASGVPHAFAPRRPVVVSRAPARRLVSRSERIPTANSATRQDFSAEAKNHLTEDLIGTRRSSTKRLGRRCFALQPAIKIRFPRAAVGKDMPPLLASALREYPYQVSPDGKPRGLLGSSAPNQLCEKHSGYILFSSHVFYLSNAFSFYCYLHFFYLYFYSIVEIVFRN